MTKVDKYDSTDSFIKSKCHSFCICIRGYFTLNLLKSSCAKTEHLLRAQSIPNERSIHKEGKMYS